MIHKQSIVALFFCLVAGISAHAQAQAIPTPEKLQRSDDPAYAGYVSAQGFRFYFPSKKGGDYKVTREIILRSPRIVEQFRREVVVSLHDTTMVVITVRWFVWAENEDTGEIGWNDMALMSESVFLSVKASLGRLVVAACGPGEKELPEGLQTLRLLYCRSIPQEVRQ